MADPSRHRFAYPSPGDQSRQRRSRRGRLVGLGIAAGLVVLPLASAPPAPAEVVDDMLDQFLTPFPAATIGTVDWAASPTPAAWDASPVELNGVVGSGAAASVAPLYDPLHTAAENWIDSDLGKQVDGIINTVFGSTVIGNGAAGTADHPGGGAGGWLVGDGGPGWDSTESGVGGGAGGSAGIFGNGGDGGNGGAGAAGGDGGNGGSLMGVGGNGGNAGDGDAASGLPALGGAGGDAGLFGSHGAVGHYGAPSVPPSPGTGGLEASGSWITESDGRVAILHGLNEVYKIPPYEPSAIGFGDDDAAFLAANGFNVVRLGVIWAGVEPEPGVFNDAYLASIAQTAQTLSNHGIRVILDMHQDLYSNVFGGEGAPAWATQTGGLANPHLSFPLAYFLNPAQQHAWDAFWSNSAAPNGVGLESSYAQMWEHVANYFAGDPALKDELVGYEIMNEPSAGSQELTNLFSPHFGAQQLTPFYNQVDSAIRAVDPNTPVFFEPEAVKGEFLPTALGAVNDPNSVYSFHDYLGYAGPLASLGVNNAEAYAKAHDIPAFMTEFGSGGSLKNLGNTIQAADQSLIGWTEWEYSALGDITTTGNGMGWLVHDPSLPPTGDNVSTDKLAVLAEPYPQVVAGTPNSWSFANGTFNFSYSTAMADGSGSFGAGAQTDISVPKIDFPDGYQVSVTGGHVVSAAGAPVLVIVADPGATTVGVVVSGTAGGASGTA